MLKTSPSAGSPKGKSHAPLFAALGDPTRLALVTRLCAGPARSISQLAQDSRFTRQAIAKHLRVLERAGIVRSVRVGREHRFAFKPEPIADLQAYLAVVSQQWDQALARLKAYVER